jgi:CheY-like chemotaxis protein
VAEPTARSTSVPADLRVLVVDDNAPTLRLIGDILRGAGVGLVETAESAVEALKKLNDIRPHILFLGCNMPGMDGLAMTKIIRAAALNPDPMVPDPAVPIIMVTGQRREIDVEAARLAGVTEFIVKPFAPKVLIIRLQSVLTGGRDFVVAEGYVGPDRRRRNDTAYAGPRRRTADAAAFDQLRQQIRDELDAIRHLAKSRGGGDLEIHTMAYDAMKQTIKRARTIRDTAIEQASKSLVRYIDAIGGPAHADGKVIDVHLDAMGKLLVIGDGSRAAHIVTQRLKAAVDRKLSRPAG